MPALQAVQRPGGALPEWRWPWRWRCGTARRGSAGSSGPTRAAAPQPRTATLALEDAPWARRALRRRPARRAPRRMQDVLAAGDVVLVESAARHRRPGPHRPARPERLALRQMPEVEGAVVALDPATGRVLAMAGGWSFDKSQFNRATQAHAPARLLLQALRLPAGAGGGDSAEPALPRRADRDQRRRRASGGRPTTTAAAATAMSPSAPRWRSR